MANKITYVVTIETQERDGCGNPIPVATAGQVRRAIAATVQGRVTVTTREDEMGMPTNERGVPYYPYTLVLKDGNSFVMNVGYEDEWANVKRCFTDWDGKEHRPCVGWGDADKWVEVTDVIDGITGLHLMPLEWGEMCVWNFAKNYAE